VVVAVVAVAVRPSRLAARPAPVGAPDASARQVDASVPLRG
jgi:hypothetical protein